MRETALFTTEAEFREWFDQHLEQFDIREIVLSQEPCPDYVVIMNNGTVAKVEAELFAINFKYHGHDPNKVDFIVACYSKTEEVEGVPVKAVHRLWSFDIEPEELLPPDAELSEDEAHLLSAIHSSGGLSVTALSQDELAGDQVIWKRVHPEIVDSIPRGKIPESVFNVMSQKSKEWIKKYHHFLVGAGISPHGCELIQSLVRRGLVKYRPISFISAAHDGTIVEHPAWIPTELYATDDAWEYHKDGIMKYLFGVQKSNG